MLDFSTVLPEVLDFSTVLPEVLNFSTVLPEVLDFYALFICIGDAKGLKLTIILAKLSLNLWPFGPFQIVYIYTRTVYMCFCAAIIYKSSVMGVSGIFPDVQYFPFQLIIVLDLGSATFFFLTLELYFKVPSNLILVIPVSQIKISSTERLPE